MSCSTSQSCSTTRGAVLANARQALRPARAEVQRGVVVHELLAVDEGHGLRAVHHGTRAVRCVRGTSRPPRHWWWWA